MEPVMTTRPVGPARAMARSTASTTFGTMTGAGTWDANARAIASGGYARGVSGFATTRWAARGPRASANALRHRLLPPVEADPLIPNGPPDDRHRTSEDVGLGGEDRDRALVDGDDAAPGLDDPRLLPGDAVLRLPQVLRVLQADASEHCDERVDHVRRVHAAAHPDLDHADVDLPLGEVVERHRGRDLEERGLEELRAAGRLRDRGLHLLVDAGDVRVGDLSPVDLNSLVEPDEVRGRVQTRAISRLPQDGGDVRAHGALPVRPRHVDGLEPPMRVPHVAEELRDRLEAELDPEPLEAVQLVQQDLVVHRPRGNPGGGVKGSRIRRALEGERLECRSTEQVHSGQRNQAAKSMSRRDSAAWPARCSMDDGRRMSRPARLGCR